MQRKTLKYVVIFLILLTFFGCTQQKKQQALVDGTYTAEFKDYDAYGYKDFITVEVENGLVVKVQFDGKNAEGALKTGDEKYQNDMEKTQETAPKRYTADLSNQLLEKGDIAQVDDIAGATWSSECFKALYNALLQANMATGDTATLLVDNVPEK